MNLTPPIQSAAPDAPQEASDYLPKILVGADSLDDMIQALDPESGREVRAKVERMIEEEKPPLAIAEWMGRVLDKVKAVVLDRQSADVWNRQGIRLAKMMTSLE